MRVWIKYCSITSISFKKEIECFTIEYKGKDKTRRWDIPKFTYSCVDKTCNYKSSYNLDGRNRKKFPCYMCNHKCKENEFKYTSKPLFLFIEKEVE